MPVRGYVDDMALSYGFDLIPRRPRSYEQGDFPYVPVRYLPLLDRKPGALKQAAPLQGWELPNKFAPPRRLLRARIGRRRKREYVQVLKPLETPSQQEVVAVRDYP